MQKKNKILTMFFLILIILIIAITGYKVYSKLATINFNNYSNLLGINSNGSLIDDYSNLEDSHISGEEYTFDTLYYPYYGNLNTKEKALYKQIYANLDNLETTFVPVVEIDKDDVADVIDSVLNDHPEVFWMGQSYNYKYTKDGICRQIILDYNKLAKNYENNKANFEYQANIIINGASRLSTNYQKELYVHDALLKKISYDSNSAYNQTAYSALVNNSTVCAGYARAFQYIMTKLSIPTYYVTGVSEGEDHAWNMIKLDGYYNVDLTWDDAASFRYQFFNLTDYEFSKTHERSTLSSSLPRCNVTTYSYSNQNKKATTNNDSNKETTPKKVEPQTNNQTKPEPKPEINTEKEEEEIIENEEEPTEETKEEEEQEESNDKE